MCTRFGNYSNTINGGRVKLPKDFCLINLQRICKQLSRLHTQNRIFNVTLETLIRKFREFANITHHLQFPRIAWGFGMSAYQNSGMFLNISDYMKFDIFYLIKYIKLHIVTDIKEKRKSLRGGYLKRSERPRSHTSVVFSGHPRVLVGRHAKPPSYSSTTQFITVEKYNGFVKCLLWKEIVRTS